MPGVKVLVEGVHKMIGEDKLTVGANTTLIRSNINIIVDPGSFVNKDKLLEALENEGLEAKDIEAVILTHSHIDHTIDHISVVVGTDIGKVVVAGDAVASEAWADTVKQPEAGFVYSVEKYNKSRKKILEIADYIIPGHGEMFKVKK